MERLKFKDGPSRPGRGLFGKVEYDMWINLWHFLVESTVLRLIFFSDCNKIRVSQTALVETQLCWVTFHVPSLKTSLFPRHYLFVAGFCFVLVFEFLDIRLRALGLLGKCCTMSPIPQP